MNPYTIVKVLGLCLGAVSVVTRSLPEQRSEINARAAGGHGFSNTPAKHDSADAEVELFVSNATLDQVDQRLEGVDHVVFLKRDSDPSAIDLRGAICSFTRCVEAESEKRSQEDCNRLIERISKKQADFTVGPQSWFFPITEGKCALGLYNAWPNPIVYDYTDFVNAAQYLNQDICPKPVQQCTPDGIVSVTLAHPSWFFT